MGHLLDLKTQFGVILRENGIKDEILEVVTKSVPELKVGNYSASYYCIKTLSLLEIKLY